MTRETKSTSLARQAELKARALRNLKRVEDRARQHGKPLQLAARLRAAMFLGDLWQQAKKKGMRQEDLKDGLSGLHEDFRIERWTLRRKDTDRQFSELRAEYANAKHPSRNLATYLRAIEVICAYLKKDTYLAKLSFCQKLELFDNQIDDDEETDFPAEDLQLMFEKVAQDFLAQSDWSKIHTRMRQMPFVVDIWSGQFKHSKASWFITEMTGLPFEDCWYSEEIFPHPAVSLGRWKAHEYQVTASLEPLGVSMADAVGSYQSPLENFISTQESIDIRGTLKIWHEVSLAIVPVISGGFAPFLRFGLRHSLEPDLDQQPLFSETWVERSNGIPDLMKGRGLVTFDGQTYRLFLHDANYHYLAASNTYPDYLNSAPGEEEVSQFNASKWEFRPLTSRLIRWWLGTEHAFYSRVVTLDESGLSDALVYPNDKPTFIPAEECRFATVQVGQAVESAIYSGAIFATLLQQAQAMDAQARVIHQIWTEKSERHVARFLGPESI